MKPQDLHLFRSYGPPTISEDGKLFATLTTPDVARDEYRNELQRIDSTGSVQFTAGTRDSSPLLSPDGRLLVFLRSTGAGEPSQLFTMPVGGGEAQPLTDHPLGAMSVSFSPDSRRIAYQARVPDNGRYGHSIDETITAPPPHAEAPRRIEHLSYREDNIGFLHDRPVQIFVIDLPADSGAPVADLVPQQVTDEPWSAGKPTFTADSAGIVYTRRPQADDLHDELVYIAVPAVGDRPQRGQIIAKINGDVGHTVVVDHMVFYLGTAFDGIDFPGRTVGLWKVPLAGGVPRRLTDEATVHIDGAAGAPIIVGDSVFVAVLHRGAVELRTVPISATHTSLNELPVIIGEQQVVKSFAVSTTHVAAVVANANSAGDIVTCALDGSDRQELTDVSEPLRSAGMAELVEIDGTAPDGYPIHGYLVLPPADVGAAPHPVLLNIHGGPHTAYGPSILDEAQMYAAHGYAVVLPNPRGSAGYGQHHGRAIVGKLGTVDADDVLALLDTALAHPTYGHVLDPERAGVMGGSYGGFMTGWLAAHAPDRFVAGISERAVNAWDSFAGSSDIGYFFAESYVGADRDTQWDRSPLAHADKISIPLLIIHSEHDWRCPLEQAQRLFVSLKLRDHDTQMLLFPGEGHELSRSGRPQHRRQRFEAILEWWDRYLPVDSSG